MSTTTKAKNVPNLSREEFDRNAGSQIVTIAGKEFLAGAKEFSTGSLGWGLNDSFLTTINGVAVKVQVGMNLTIANTKDLPARVLTPAIIAKLDGALEAHDAAVAAAETAEAAVVG